MKQQTQRWLHAAVFVACVFIAPSILPRALMAADRPNVITIFIDDMGWSDLSCFEGTRVTTENIDSLAAEGLRFTNFYVNAPICSPSRVALSTGQYPHRWQITSYLANRKLNRDRGVAQWLDPAAPMLARELQKSGYTTGHFGKWHMGGQRDVGDAPLITDYGFDRSLTNFEGLGPRVLPLKDAYDGKPPEKHDLGSGDLAHGPIHWIDRSVVTAAFVQEAITFIDQAQKDEKPFFINLWPDDVHSPFFPPEVLRDKTDGSKHALYDAVLDAMDQQIGRLIDRIRNDQQLRNNTLILVMSDNGHEEGAGSSDPLRGAKTWLYEGGVRSPLIVWGPGLLAETVAGTTNDKSVLCALDVNRSLYTLTQTPVPDSVELDGEDLGATLLGRELNSRGAPIFWRRPPDRPGTSQDDNPDLAVRHGNWKYLVNYDGTDAQLYDLTADVSEKQNVRNENADVVSRLHQRLMQWNASMPTDAGDPNWVRSEIIGPISSAEFVNPIGEGADPWVIRDPQQDRYLWCMSEGNRAIAIHASERLTSMGRKHVVWTAPETGPVSREVWAPELHWLDEHWHIYFAASDGRNENHLAYVLKSKTSDPLGEYKLHGPLATGDGNDGRSPNIWAIDMTVLELNHRRYAIWSGWDAPGTDRQYLYIAAMKSPTELESPRVRLCANDDYLWERLEPNASKRGLNEGPQVFQAKGETFVLYSCAASWLPTYKLGLLQLVGDNPLDHALWKKRPRPVFEGTDDVYGVGHSCFVKSPDDESWWHVFHAKRDRNPGWRRAVFVQPMKVGARGLPQLGVPVASGEPLNRPAGERTDPASLPITLFPNPDSRGRSQSAVAWSAYGHHQFIDEARDGLHLGRVPTTPINEYRSGEKIVLDQRCPNDVRVEVTIGFRGNQQARDAGILLRCSAASVGYDAQRGYFAGLIPKTNLVILGRTDGNQWTELARAPVEINAQQPQKLTAIVTGDKISVSHNGRQCLSVADPTFPSGSVGLRVVDTHAVFSNFTITQSAP